ncbi:McrB family protein [Peribacillus asahii]|uniref:McrB family protein n=1 Tax=Peribacillus asahii TaxID=228899 RepID=UPI00380922FF
MRITNHSFEVFERTNFIYRKHEEGAQQVKLDYTSAWNDWKKIVKTSVKDSDSDNLTIESTENWQNSGNLSRRFWSRIKDKQLLDVPSCIAAMISKDHLRVYLEWHGYKNEALHEERKVHNNWINFIDTWIEETNIDISKYIIWTNKDDDDTYRNYTMLEEFINNGDVRKNLLNVIETDSKNWIRIGKIFLKQDVLHHEDITSEMGQVIKELEWLYRKATIYTSKKEEEGVKQVREQSDTFLTNQDLIHHIHSYIQSKGFFYTKEEVTNLFLSIKTKPFVILSGISGTGKTKIVQWFAESVWATEENGQFVLIPIRPDWNDGSDLLGYTDIKGDFIKGPLTKAILEADRNPEKPYFVLLDEMNLARVEHYFSDILSVMESRKWQEGEMVTSTLLRDESEDKDIKLPTNLYIIGTVNMDETTYPFSKKVLDRANTIEFNRVELSNLAFLEEQSEVEAIAIRNSMLCSKYLHLKDLYSENPELVHKVTTELEHINQSLQLTNAHIGYRVRDEICFYLAYNEDSELMSFEETFDYCILQKILPRISGSDTRVEQLLMGLYRLFTGKEYTDEFESYDNDMKFAKYPKSAAKVLEMLRRLRDDGFTSFWVS